MGRIMNFFTIMTLFYDPFLGCPRQLFESSAFLSAGVNDARVDGEEGLVQMQTTVGKGV